MHAQLKQPSRAHWWARAAFPAPPHREVRPKDATDSAMRNTYTRDSPFYPAGAVSYTHLRAHETSAHL
eukprot:15390685-Alexandrium_andersonii.AAC.1